MPYLDDVLVRREFSVRWKSPVRSEVEEDAMESLCEATEEQNKAAKAARAAEREAKERSDTIAQI